MTDTSQRISDAGCEVRLQRGTITGNCTKQRRVDRDWSGSGNNAPDSCWACIHQHRQISYSVCRRRLPHSSHDIARGWYRFAGICSTLWSTAFNVRAGVESLPPDLVQQLVKNLKFQTFSILLLYASVVSVNF